MAAISNERPPTGYTGKPATDFRMGLVRFATSAEATAGIANNLAITPAELAASGAANFASPPVLGSTTPNAVHATTLAVTTSTAHGVLIGEAAGNVASTSAGTLGQFFISGGPSADPSFQTATPQLVVTPVAGTTQAMTSGHTYIANNASLTTFTLPATSAVGDILKIVGSALNTGGWKVTYTTGQIIWGPAGSSTVTTGNAASATAAAQVMTMQCVVANTTWVITDNSGTITLT
jgi:hypothetical protein